MSVKFICSDSRIGLVALLILQSGVIDQYRDILAKAQEKVLDCCIKSPGIKSYNYVTATDQVEKDFIYLLSEFYTFLLFSKTSDDELKTAVILLAEDIKFDSEGERRDFEIKKSKFLFSGFYRNFSSFNVAVDKNFQKKVDEIVEKVFNNLVRELPTIKIMM